MSGDVFARIITSMFRLYWRHSRGLELAVQVVVRNRAGDVLLVQDADGRLQLPDTRVEAGEAAADAARRVVGQHIGGASVGAVSLVGIVYCAPDARTGARHVAVFAGNIDEAGASSFEREDGPRWVASTDLPSAVADSSAFRLA